MPYSNRHTVSRYIFSRATGHRLRLEPLEDRRLLSAAAELSAVELFHASPALFVENQGQWEDESIRFLHQGDGVNVAMTDAGPVFQLFRSEPVEGADAGDELHAPFDPFNDLHGPDDVVTEVTQFSAHFDGANVVEPVGLDRAETYSNYFVGEQGAWRSGVPAYETVAYEGLYDDIDLLTWGQRDSLKYEFHVAPGADYRQIRVHYQGIEGLRLDDAGALHVETTLGELVDEAPYIYQQVDGQQVEVAGEFALIDQQTYAFTITGPYDAAVELVIDPDLAWSTYLGGSDNEGGGGIAVDIAVDAAGNALVTGVTYSPGWVSGGFDTSLDGDYDAFVAKLSPTGSHVWSTYLGGSDSDGGSGIAVDGAGNALVTGYTGSAGWVSGGFDTSYNGDYDAFVAKLSPTGGQVWSTYLGGSENESGSGIAVDDAGNALVTGETGSAGWVSGGFDTSPNGHSDAFVAKLSPTGGQVWSTYLGGSSRESGSGIAVDAAGNALVAGSTYSPGWVSGGFDTSFDGRSDAFVAKLSPAGGHLWSTYLGGSSHEFGSGIAVDAAGNALVKGRTRSPGWVSGGYDTTFNGGDKDAFVAKLSPSGDHLWSTYLGGSFEDQGFGGIAVDAAGNALVVGWTYSPGWVSGGFDTSLDGESDAFVAKLSATGGHLWSTYLGGTERDRGFGIAVDGAGNALVTGTTHSPGWVSGGFDTSLDGESDAFVARITEGPTDDSYEPDNSLLAPHDLSAYEGEWLNTIDGPGVQRDEDWHRVEIPATDKRLVVDLSFAHADGDVNLQVVNASGEVWISSESTTDDEHVDTVLPWEGPWYLRVYGDNAGNTYDLRWDAQYVHPGDANLDGRVDAADLNVVALNWRGNNKTWTQGDFTGDGIVDAADLNELALNWQSGVEGQALAATSVTRTGEDSGSAGMPRASLAITTGPIAVTTEFAASNIDCSSTPLRVSEPLLDSEDGHSRHQDLSPTQTMPTKSKVARSQSRPTSDSKAADVLDDFFAELAATGDDPLRLPSASRAAISALSRMT
jgi:hypothetical protein